MYYKGAVQPILLTSKILCTFMFTPFFSVQTIFQFSWPPNKLNDIHTYSSYVTSKLVKNNKTPSSKLVKNQWQKNDFSGHFFSLNASFRFVSCRPWDQWPDTSLLSPLRESCVMCKDTHNQPPEKTKHRHHGPPNPPAPSAIAVRCAIDHDHCNPAMWLYQWN